MTTDAKKPIKEFRVRGGIKAAIWQNEVVLDGRPVLQHSVKIQRSYKDKTSGDWKTTDYFRPQDLPCLVLAAQKAFEFISLTESGNGENTLPESD